MIRRMPPELEQYLLEKLHRYALRYLECLIVVLCPWVLLFEQPAEPYGEVERGSSDVVGSGEPDSDNHRVSIS